MFKALADPTRRQILYDLRKRELSAGELASHFPISGPSVSRHLAVLKSAGLVTERRQANKVFYTLAFERLAASVGTFLSTLSPERPERSRRGKKKSKPAEKGATKKRRKGTMRRGGAGLPEGSEASYVDASPALAPAELSAKA